MWLRQITQSGAPQPGQSGSAGFYSWAVPAQPPLPALVDSPRALLMWSLGVLAYASAILHRTSFGVASVLAADRFSVGASLASLFVVVQLITYAAMQVPVGLLADRYGTRAVVTCGALLMCAGQFGLAFSTSLPLAVAARVLVGAGDAMTFTAVLRMLPAWFSPGRLPVLNQLTSLLGQFGQLLSSIPLAALLIGVGWEAAFSIAALFAAGVAVLVGTLLRNTPPGTVESTGERPDPWSQVREVLRIPQTQVAFWVHWTSSIWGLVFPLMWGYPFLINGMGYGPAVASGLLAVFVLANVPMGLMFGLLSRRAPAQRVNLALIVSLFGAVPWAVVLLWPGAAPLWLLVLLMIGISASGPGAAIAFDIVRAGNPLRQIGTASGFVIVGGFFAGLATILTIGLVLDLAGGQSLNNFRWAMSAQFVFWAIGLLGMYSTRAVGRRLDSRRGVRYTGFWTLLRREVRHAIATLGGRGQGAEPVGSLKLSVGIGRSVRVAAVLPGTGGLLVAVDVPAVAASEQWWHDRVGDYLEIVDSPELQIGAVEVRCPNRTESARVRAMIGADLALRGASLSHEVRTQHH